MGWDVGWDTWNVYFFGNKQCNNCIQYVMVYMVVVLVSMYSTDDFYLSGYIQQLQANSMVIEVKKLVVIVYAVCYNTENSSAADFVNNNYNYKEAFNVTVTPR